MPSIVLWWSNIVRKSRENPVCSPLHCQDFKHQNICMRENYTWHRVTDGRDERLSIVSKSGTPLEEKAVISGIPSARFATVGDEEVTERFGRGRCCSIGHRLAH